MGRNCQTGLCRDEPAVQPVRAFARSVHCGNRHGEAGGECRSGPDGRLDERPAGPDIRAGNGRRAGHDRYGRHGGDDGRAGGSERDGVVGMSLPYTIRPAQRHEIRDFIEKWHYSHSINGVKDKYNFKLLQDGELIGAAMFAELAMEGQYKKYCDNEKDIVELRRLCCIDATLKNTESFFIWYCIRWLKRYSDIKVIVSYADPNYNHAGTIYHASNFKYLGLTAKSACIEWEGKLYHDHAIRTKYNGKLKPFAQKLKDAIDRGEAHKKVQLPKHIFVYNINRKKNIVQSKLLV